MKNKVIFIGSFKTAAQDGSVGGQMYACNSLVNSLLKNEVDFILIDSTAESVPAPPFYKRLPKAILRVVDLLKELCGRNVSSVLIFSSAGQSFVEKGLMALMSKLFGKKVLFAPRSGLIKDNYENSTFFKWYIPLIIKYSDVVICQGNVWRDFYKEISQVDDHKFLVIPNWINVKPYIDNNPVYNSSKAVMTILYMGWLERYKGVFDFIDSLRLLRDKGVDFKVKICGMGSAKDEMLNLIKEYRLEGHVEYVGWVVGPEKMEQFTKTDIFVLPSHREGMPNVVMEAMASGIPVVATRVGGVPELIQDGVNGFLVDLGRSDQLFVAIERLIYSEELRCTFSENARRFIIENNSVELTVEVFKKQLL